MKLAVLSNFQKVGKLHGKGASFESGQVKHFVFNDVTGLGSLLKITSSSPKLSVCVGNFPKDGVVKPQGLAKADEMTRTKDNVGLGNILVIDNDSGRDYSKEYYSKYWKAFENVGYVTTQSGSTLAGLKKNGTHTYYVVDDGKKHIKEAMGLMEAIFIIEGECQIEFWKTGKAIVKTPVDMGMYQPTRILYEDDVSPVVTVGNNLQLSKFPKDHSKILKRAERIKREMLAEVEDEEFARHGKYVKKVTGKKLKGKKALKKSLARFNKYLVDEHLKLYRDGKVIGTIGQLLRGRIDSEGGFADLYEPQYGGGSQKAIYYEDTQTFFSQAHGGIHYTVEVTSEFETQEKLDTEKLETAPMVASNKAMDIGGEFDDDEVGRMLATAKSINSLEYDRVRKMLKEKTNYSLKALDEMASDAMLGKEGISQFFNGEVVWDSSKGVFCVVKDNCVDYIAKGNFPQTVISRSGWMTPTDVTERLSSIPNKLVVYKPDVNDRDTLYKGEDAINCYRGVVFDGVGDKIPKLTDKLLDNLFLSDKKAKKRFIHWMAYILQYRKATGLAWGFFGASGTGKGLISELMERLVGADNSSMNITDTILQSSFNQYAHNVMFVHLNEVASDFHGRHGIAGWLKTLITDSTLQINIKGLTAIEADNYVNVMLNSNKAKPIEIDDDDRRWNMIVTNNPLKNCAWFKAGKTGDKILEEYQEFGAYLMKVDVNEEWALQPMENSRAKQNIAEQTLSNTNLLGIKIKAGEFDSLMEYLDLDSTDFNISVDEIKDSCETKRWRTSLLFELYMLVNGNPKNISSHTVSKVLVKPFITSAESKPSKKGRYYQL